MVGHGSGIAAGVRGARNSPVRSLRRPPGPIAVLAVALSGACGPAGLPVPAEVVLSVGYAAPAEAGAATALDTLIDQLTREGLFRSGPDGRIEALLAETWDVAPDGTAVTVVLRRDAAFHDGSLGDVAEAMQGLAETAGVGLDVRLTARGSFIEGDLFALGRVYRNLILNAIEATAPGGVVTLWTEERNGRIQILVGDTGTGIPHDRLENIFEDFKTTKRTGLGLGLTISRKIVNQLGGNIAVTSTVGRGTTFSLEFARAEGRPDSPTATAAAG